MKYYKRSMVWFFFCCLSLLAFTLLHFTILENNRMFDCCFAPVTLTNDFILCMDCVKEDHKNYNSVTVDGFCFWFFFFGKMPFKNFCLGKAICRWDYDAYKNQWFKWWRMFYDFYKFLKLLYFCRRVEIES